MKLSQFKFKLPEEKIALHPTKYRDESRLLVLHRKTGEIEHKMFKDVLDYFDDKDVFIFNDTKVFPARLYGNKEKTGARIEVFLLRELNEELRLWDVLVDPARKIRIGNKLYFGDDDSMVAEVIDNTTSRGRTLRFLYDGPHDEFKKALYALGETPLPHSIINRPVEPDDAERFQSIFARNEGAVTAPTASLHFSRELMKRMEIKGIDFAYITLHAGLGNFRERIYRYPYVGIIQIRLSVEGFAFLSACNTSSRLKCGVIIHLPSADCKCYSAKYLHSIVVKTVLHRGASFFAPIIDEGGKS